MIPKYPFVVHVDIGRRAANEEENHNCETLQDAGAYASMALRKPTVTHGHDQRNPRRT